MMVKLRQLLPCTLLAFAIQSVSSNIPCSAKKEAGGYVCVCNATNCDTIQRPNRLSRKHYHHYITSESSPGFTHTIGRFDSSTENKLPLDLSSDVFISVNSSIKYQTFTGVGGAITDCVGINFNNLPPGAQENLVESFFGKSGIEYTFLRVPIASSDFSLRFYTYDDVPGDLDLKYFNLTAEDFTLKIPLLQRALKASVRGLKLMGSSWTAPSWMKTNNNTRQGYLLRKYQETWARYHLKFLEAYRALGIEYWGITVGNELIISLFFGSFFDMPNMVMMPFQANQWTKHYLGPIVKNNGFDKVKILTLDDERPFMTWWDNRTLSDKRSAKYIDGVALHWYLDSNSSIQNLEVYHDMHPDKLLLYTESSINSILNGEDAFPLGEWSRGVRYINNIYQNWGHWVSSYIDWNIALDEEGGPSYSSNHILLDASVIVNASAGEFYKQPIFYVLGHFSKFIVPGSQKIHITIKQDTPDALYDDRSELELLNEMKEKLLKRQTNMRKGFKTYNLQTQNSDMNEFNGGTHPTHKRQLNNFTTTPPTSRPPSTGGPTRNPIPTRKPDPPSNTVLALASSNPDGSISLIVYNPRSEPANLIIEDPLVGRFNKTVDTHSLNSFIYWP